jgi:hypothetical protein
MATIVCVTANTTFVVTSVIGNITVGCDKQWNEKVL